MTDLDARIRERISEREPIAEWPGFAYDAVQALREVLKFAKDIEDAPQYYTAGIELQEIIAEELGVTDGER